MADQMDMKQIMEQLTFQSAGSQAALKRSCTAYTSVESETGVV